MKRSILSFLATLLLLIGFSGANLAQELPYREGAVWQISFIKTEPGMFNKYLRDLNANWKPWLEEAKKEGLVLSYRILSGSAANREDWNLMLMVQFKNMAALDGLDEKSLAIDKKLYGSEEKVNNLMEEISKVREILGEKVMREIILK